MKLIFRVILMAAALWVAIWLVPGLEFDGGPWAFFLVSALIVAANFIIKPILNLLSLPFILLTFGLFLLVTNALVLEFVIWLSGPDRFALGLTSTGFFWATFLGALVISVVRMVLDRFER
ncbi:MAG: phage holin family protein [Actinomycetota bacterium]|nr:phage holin family protein [Actinomycetota bacterium]